MILSDYKGHVANWMIIKNVICYKNNARDTNYFTNCWYSEWLLVNKKNNVNGGSKWKPIRSWSYQ